MTVRKSELISKTTRQGEEYWKISNKDLRKRIYLFSDEDGMLSAGWMYTVADLLSWKEVIQEWCDDKKVDYSELPEFLSERIKEKEEFVASSFEEGKFTFLTLKSLFKVGTEIVTRDGDGNLQGGVVTACQMRNSFMGPFIVVNYYYSTQTNAGIQNRIGNKRIFHYRGQREISRLPVKLISPEEKATLSVRGEKFAKLNQETAFVLADGKFSYDFTWWGDKSLGVKGRFVVDVPGFCRFDSNMADRLGLSARKDNSWIDPDGDGDEDNAQVKLWTCPAYVYGFSLARKAWGRHLIDDVSPVEYRDDAIDRLVLDDSKKHAIMALCKASGKVFGDIVDSKGDGTNLILAGVPGTGKTLTAEAVAEKLHRPLYIIGSGELGATPENVEERLREVLNIAKSWNAVVLIDEAEVFMVQRQTGDVLRNAMVSIFLRALEQHNTVLFLTTNRIDDIDPAFHSRISLIVNYDSLGYDERKSVWANLLDSAGLSPRWAGELADAELNGREIKHRIRIAQALAAEKGAEVSIGDIQEAIRISPTLRRDR